MPRRVVQTSGTSTAKPGRKPLAPSDPQAILERFKDFAAIDIVSRRFTDPNDPGSLPIFLADEDPHCCTNSDHQYRLKPGAVTCGASLPNGKPCPLPARRWYVRWFNLAKEGRNAQMRSKGYLPVELKELLDTNDVADRFASKEDTYVRRGDRGQEVLAKQPLELYNEIKRRQRAQRDGAMRSAKQRRAERAEHLGATLGDEAGQRAYDGEIMEESFKRTRSTLAAEADIDQELEELDA